MDVKDKESSQEGFSFIISVTFTLNYIIGTGFLTLPWAFFASGEGLGIAVLVFVTFLAVCSALMILEAMSRAAVLTTSSTLESKSSSHSKTRQYALQNYSAISSNDNQEQDREDIVVSHHLTSSSRKSAEGGWLVGKRRIEIVELCEKFYPQGKSFFIFILSIYMYGALWAYCTVFANALSTTLPIMGDYSYHCYLLIYAVIVVPTSCLELSEQVSIQMFYALCRVLLIISMLGTIAFACIETDSMHKLPQNGEDNFIRMFKWSGFKTVVPICLYANIFHHSIPALSELAANKKQLGWIFTSTLGICFCAYAIIGSTLSTYYGASILSSSNLNWADFFYKNESAIMFITSNYIVLFPAVDVMSAFPLSAITLGNNVQAFIVGSDNISKSSISCSINRIKEGESISLDELSISVPDNSQVTSRRLVSLYRCVAALPPVLGACFVRDLGIITKYTGITGFAIIFFYPVLLCYRSRCLFVERGINSDTFYTCILTSSSFMVILVLFGIFMVFLTLLT